MISGAKKLPLLKTRTHCQQLCLCRRNIIGSRRPSKIVGLSKWVHDPGLSMGYKQAEDVPGIVENNLESVIALKPDLLFVADTAKKNTSTV